MRIYKKNMRNTMLTCGIQLKVIQTLHQQFGVIHHSLQEIQQYDLAHWQQNAIQGNLKKNVFILKLNTGNINCLEEFHKLCDEICHEKITTMEYKQYLKSVIYFVLTFLTTDKKFEI